MTAPPMNLQTTLQLFAQVSPAAFKALDTQVTSYLTTAGASLALEQIMFVRNNFKELPEGLKTPEGKVAVQTFVQDWIAGARQQTPQ